LPGQVIVCEQAGADWLPFRSFSGHEVTLRSFKRSVVDAAGVFGR
jgi:hypothetical protein